MARKKLKDVMHAPAIDDQWQVEEDLRTIQRAGEIMSDPKRKAKCMDLHKEQMEGMEKMLGAKMAGYHKG